MSSPTELSVSANGIDFVGFEMGSGPLALCLHGYPDTAHTFRHLLPRLADNGFRAVAPFMRGYAPTSLAPEDSYQSGVLGVDANALHEALGGDGDAVIIGHDWGALGTYAAAVLEPARWRRVVAMAVPPGPVAAAGFFNYDQLRTSWYMFFQLHPLSDMVVPHEDFEFVARLWADWSPGYDATQDLEWFRQAMATPAHVTAALSYYRHTLGDSGQRPELAEAQGATLAVPPQPLLYLHGRNDGCMLSTGAAAAADLLATGGSRAEMIEDAGHFLHLEQPEIVNAAIVDFVSS
jgi:pimeloyl-ACP methyl ester carboxylesterase